MYLWGDCFDGYDDAPVASDVTFIQDRGVATAKRHGNMKAHRADAAKQDGAVYPSSIVGSGVLREFHIASWFYTIHRMEWPDYMRTSPALFGESLGTDQIVKKRVAADTRSVERLLFSLSGP